MAQGRVQSIRKSRRMQQKICIGGIGILLIVVAAGTTVWNLRFKREWMADAGESTGR